MPDLRSAARRVQHYSLAMVGPVGSAGAQFALSLVLLRRLDAAAFGGFSFLLVACQFSWGIWGALFCAPLPSILATGAPEARAALVRTLFSANLAAGGLALLAFLGLAREPGLAWPSAVLFAAFGATSLLRWFARTHAYAVGAPLRAAASDLVYTVVLLAGVAAVAARGDPSLALTWGSMLLGTLAAFAPFGRPYLAEQFGRFDVAALAGYAAVWRQHARWSLLGVVSTEATANAHVYIITLLRGTTSFAPLAASALLIRPINVAMNALTEFERARMARQLGASDVAGARASARDFRLALIATWIATAAATALLLAYRPGIVFPTQYSRPFLVAGSALWMAVAAVRLLRMPESCLLQAGGVFRPLALASVWASAISVVGVSVLLLAGGTLWSIVGILLGEAVFAAWIWRETRLWLRRLSAGVARGTAAAPAESVPALAPREVLDVSNVSP